MTTSFSHQVSLISCELQFVALFQLRFPAQIGPTSPLSHPLFFVSAVLFPGVTLYCGLHWCLTASRFWVRTPAVPFTCIACMPVWFLLVILQDIYVRLMGNSKVAMDAMQIKCRNYRIWLCRMVKMCLLVLRALTGQ